MKALARTLFGLLLCLAIIGCRSDIGKFSGIDLTGIQGYGSDFHLTDHTGKARTLADFRGKVVALYFGYTNCPDVCPTTLTDLSRMVEQVKSPDVRVLFVSVDPNRDTPEVLAHYAAAFSLRME